MSGRQPREKFNQKILLTGSAVLQAVEVPYESIVSLFDSSHGSSSTFGGEAHQGLSFVTRFGVISGQE